MAKPRPDKRLLDEKQHVAARRMYLGACMKPKDIAATLSKEFAIDPPLTPLQISEYARARGWTSRRKRDQQRAEILAEAKLGQAKTMQQVVAKHQDFIEATSRVGAKIVQKAEIFVERAATAKDLASAANAARTGAEIYRKAVGLEGNEPSTLVNNGTINVAFATSDDSPFARAKKHTVLEAEIITPGQEPEDDLADLNEPAEDSEVGDEGE